MFERRDHPIAGLAHELKASCVSIGAKQLARLCLYLEQAVGQQDWLEAKETVISLERSFDMLRDYVQASLETEREKPSVP
jgi:HPt (histidine-containing phosphotransfer) domain-containing protein